MTGTKEGLVEEACVPSFRAECRAEHLVVLGLCRQKTVSEVCCFMPASYHLLRTLPRGWC